MKTDTIFYRLFQEFPTIFFELIGQPELPADTYQFTSVELKQLAFRLDGLFLPPPNQPNLPMYFVEVQFQKDQGFYYRLFAEIFLYIYQYKPVNNWRAVVVYPRRSVEPEQPIQYQLLLNSNQVQIIYLDELGEFAERSLGVGIVQLVVESQQKATERARQLISQARQQVAEEQIQQQIIEFIETIVIYKFPLLSRQEVEVMLGLDLIRNTRVYQEAFAEGEQQGRLAGEQQGRLAGEQQAKLAAVKRLLELGLTLEQIAQAIELDIEVVREAAQQL
jgi:predicted transposase/invertase (TIGR01784 family)